MNEQVSWAPSHWAPLGDWSMPQGRVWGGERGSQYLCPNSCPPLVEGCPLSENLLVFAAPRARESPGGAAGGNHVWGRTGRAEEAAQGIQYLGGWRCCLHCTDEETAQRARGTSRGASCQQQVTVNTCTDVRDRPCLISLCLHFHICKMGGCLPRTDLGGSCYLQSA